MTQFNNIIFTIIVSSFMISNTYSISWSSINLNKPNKELLFQGENVHFMWESTAEDNCIDLTISMLNATNATVDSFTAERQPGFIKNIMKCVPSGQYSFKIECGQNIDIFNKIFSMTTVVDGFNFYQNPTSKNIITWHEKVARVVQKNISIYSYPDLVLLKTQNIKRDNNDNEDVSFIDFQMQQGQKYKIKAYDICNNMIGENKPKFNGEIKEFFSFDFPLEPTLLNPTQAPASTLAPALTLAPTQASTLAPTQASTQVPASTLAPALTQAPTLAPSVDRSSSAIKAKLSIGFLVFIAII